MAKRKRVVVGMSGGVDSSVAAALLLQAGYEVVGVTCDFVGSENDCCAAAEAHAVCEVLGIRHIHEDCTVRFAEQVVEPFCAAYAAGLTPSPCVGCNATMKLPALAAIADELGFAYIATGHYARVARQKNGRRAVRTATDAAKDQSYMLANVPSALLSRLVLPLGGMTKPQVRALAEELNLPVAQRPDSQDICFAPEGYRALLAEHGVETAPGPIVDTVGRVLGTHTGLADYTIGQRSGLGIGGAPEPYYVLAKDAASNALTVGFAGEARMVGALVKDPLWQAFGELPEEPFACTVKLRYRSCAVPCSVEAVPSVFDDSAGGCGEESRRPDKLRVTLEEPQPLTAPGQFAVFYSGDLVLGSGIIAEVFRR